MNARLKEIELNEDDSVKRFRLADGSTLEGDLYVSAMPGKTHLCNMQQVTGNSGHVSNQSGSEMAGSVVWAMSGLDLLCFVHMLHSGSLAVPAHHRQLLFCEMCLPSYLSN